MPHPSSLVTFYFIPFTLLLHSNNLKNLQQQRFYSVKSILLFLFLLINIIRIPVQLAFLYILWHPNSIFGNPTAYLLYFPAFFLSMFSGILPYIFRYFPPFSGIFLYISLSCFPVFSSMFSGTFVSIFSGILLSMFCGISLSMSSGIFLFFSYYHFDIFHAR